MNEMGELQSDALESFVPGDNYYYYYEFVSQDQRSPTWKGMGVGGGLISVLYHQTSKGSLCIIDKEK